ncbi:Hha/YmoA family nucleoid-associated regulatory protein [Dryocola clanedunensis]
MRKNYELYCAELAVFWGATDHRLAEFIADRLSDRIPACAWQYVR